VIDGPMSIYSTRYVAGLEAERDRLRDALRPFTQATSLDVLPDLVAEARAALAAGDTGAAPKEER
jgi:hypothetical protein